MVVEIEVHIAAPIGCRIMGSQLKHPTALQVKSPFEAKARSSQRDPVLPIHGK